MIQPDEYVHFKTADVNLQNQRHYQTYNDFVPAVRDRFPATGDIAVRLEFPDPNGGQIGPWMRLRNGTPDPQLNPTVQSDLYLIAIHDGGQWRAVPANAVNYPNAYNGNLSVGALQTMCTQAGNWALGGPQPGLNLQDCVTVLAFFTAEAARFDPVCGACRSVIQGRVAEYNNWNTWRDLLTNWTATSDIQLEGRTQVIPIRMGTVETLCTRDNLDALREQMTELKSSGFAGPPDYEAPRPPSN